MVFIFDFFNISIDIDWNTWYVTGINILKNLIIVLIIWQAGKLLIKGLKTAMNKAHLDDTVSKFIVPALKTVLYLVVIVLLLNAFGIDTGSVVTIIGAMGLSLSLVLKDSLSSIAQGIFLLTARPFSVGQEIEAEGIEGICTVQKITLFYTEFLSKDGMKILIPNDKMSKMIIKIKNDEV